MLTDDLTDEAATAPAPARFAAPGTGAGTVFVAFSKDPNPKVVRLDLGGAGHVETATKLALTPRAAVQVAREAEALDRLHGSHHLGPLRPTVPAVLHREDHTVTMTALQGRSMNATYHWYRHTADRRRVTRDFALVGEWLAGFQAATVGRRQAINLDRGRSRTLRQRFAGRPHLDDDLERLTAVHARLRQGSVARAFVHGDFWAGNVLIRRRAVTGIVDWEFARPDDDPLHDIARFALSYSLYLDRHTRPGRRVPGHPGLRAGRPGAGLLYGIDGEGWYHELVRQFVGDALDRLGARGVPARDVLVAGVAAIAAEADDPDFAALHADLLHALLTGRARP